jgi:hypothetical protein
VLYTLGSGLGLARSRGCQLAGRDFLAANVSTIWLTAGAHFRVPIGDRVRRERLETCEGVFVATSATWASYGETRARHFENWFEERHERGAKSVRADQKRTRVSGERQEVVLPAFCVFRLFRKGLRPAQACRPSLRFVREPSGSEANPRGPPRGPDTARGNSRALSLPPPNQLPGRFLSLPRVRTTNTRRQRGGPGTSSAGGLPWRPLPSG